MAAILPPIPRFVFAVFEPISLIAGGVASIWTPAWFSAGQIPGTAVRALGQNDLMTTLQLGNLFLLCAMVGVGVLYTTTEPKVVKAYLVGLAIADVGHLMATYHVLGPSKYMDLTTWNAQTAGNIGATTFLFTVRCLYLLGVLGKDRVPAARSGKKKAT